MTKETFADFRWEMITWNTQAINHMTFNTLNQTTSKLVTSFSVVFSHKTFI